MYNDTRELAMNRGPGGGDVKDIYIIWRGSEMGEFEKIRIKIIFLFVNKKYGIESLCKKKIIFRKPYRPNDSHYFDGITVVCDQRPCDPMTLRSIL